MKQAATYTDADCGLESLAAAISYEVAHRCPPCAAAKPYVAALCKVRTLAAFPSACSTIHVLQLRTSGLLCALAVCCCVLLATTTYEMLCIHLCLHCQQISLHTAEHSKYEQCTRK